jgi:hypothetical protein
MFIVNPSLRLLKDPGERVQRTAAHLLDGGLELTPLFALYREYITCGVYAAPLPVHPGEYGRPPLSIFAAHLGKDPYSIHLGWRHNL